jgi:acetoin utilization deacetylase AcuC-like enzyme
MMGRILVGMLVASALASTVAQQQQGELMPVLPTAFAYHPDVLLHDSGVYHPENPERLRAIISHLQETALWSTLLHLQPEPASEDVLTLVHTPRYLEMLRQAARNAPVHLDPDTRVSAQSYRAATVAAGAVLAAVDAVMEERAQNAFAAVRPPGHHAFPQRASGFCLINNVAVAARYLQHEHGIERILIVDWDAHHGNGTQAIFYEDPSVLYFSTHQYPFYPGTGAASEIGRGAGEGHTINVPLSAGSSEDKIIKIYREQLVPAAKAFEPEFVLVSAGFDSHRDDPLAHLGLTSAGYRQLTEIVMAIAEPSAQGRIVSVLEGGYNLQALARSVAAHLEALADR